MGCEPCCVRSEASGATSDLTFDVVKYTDKQGPHFGGSSVWYRIPNPGAGRLRINGISKRTNFDAVVAVYHGPAGGILSPADLAPGPDGGHGQRFGTRKHSRPITVATEPHLQSDVCAGIGVISSAERLPLQPALPATPFPRA